MKERQWIEERDPMDRRLGELAVWWHRRNGPDDLPEAMDVSSVMGARSIIVALEREPETYHAIRVMRWDGAGWKRVKRP